MMIRKVTKKSIILDLLNKQKQVSVSDVAMLLYGNYSMLEHIKVVNLLSAYRISDPKCLCPV